MSPSDPSLALPPQPAPQEFSMTTRSMELVGPQPAQRVLVIDDNDMDRLMACQALAQAGYEVASAADGRAGLAMFRATPCDLVLMDVMMPVLDGHAACRALRELPEAAGVPVLMMTGRDDVEAIHEAYEAGATDFIGKPVRWPVLVHRVRYMLRAASTLQALHRSERRTRYLARHDTLTGLPNRQQVTEQITLALARARRRQTHTAVLLLDLDKFKRINESFGPGAGDRLLRQIGERLQQCLRLEDTVVHLDADASTGQGCVARVGGDEFALLVADLAQPRDAAKVAMRVLEALRRPLRIDEQELVITASIGISVFPVDGPDANALLVNADAAMSHAKADGGDGFTFYNKPMNASALERLSLEASLRQGLQRGEFVLHFQPQLDLVGQRVIGAEALLRWRHPTQGMVSPLSFIPLAEESGLIVPIGEWALYEACRQACTWPQEPGQPPLRVAVNLSARQFRQFALVDQVAGALAASGLAPERLELEITESCLMQDVELAIAILDRLRRLGCRVSVDDFGTGYSSLAYLKRFPIDAMKIDRYFVRGLPDESQDAAIVGAVIGMARGLGLEVVAEGVETTSQRDWLLQHGCDVAQGYLIAKPMAGEALGAFLAPAPADPAAEARRA